MWQVSDRLCLGLRPVEYWQRWRAFPNPIRSRVKQSLGFCVIIGFFVLISSIFCFSFEFSECGSFKTISLSCAIHRCCAFQFLEDSCFFRKSLFWVNISVLVSLAFFMNCYRCGCGINQELLSELNSVLFLLTAVCAWSKWLCVYRIYRCSSVCGLKLCYNMLTTPPLVFPSFIFCHSSSDLSLVFISSFILCWTVTVII